MVDGGGLENRWTKVSRVRILLPPPDKTNRAGKSRDRRGAAPEAAHISCGALFRPEQQQGVLLFLRRHVLRKTGLK